MHLPVVVALLLICLCPAVLGTSPAGPRPWLEDHGPTNPCRHYESAVASWYGPRFDGRLQADGRRFDQWGLSAAHRHLPLGTRAIVTRGSRRVEVTITDRGPYVEGRVLDLSRGAARQLGFVRQGLAAVTLDTCGG